MAPTVKLRGESIIDFVRQWRHSDANSLTHPPTPSLCHSVNSLQKIDVLIYLFNVRGPDPPTPLRQNDATGGQNRLLTHPL